jgi:hypothetical protein
MNWVSERNQSNENQREISYISVQTIPKDGMRTKYFSFNAKIICNCTSHSTIWVIQKEGKTETHT